MHLCQNTREAINTVRSIIQSGEDLACGGSEDAIIAKDVSTGGKHSVLAQISPAQLVVVWDAVLTCSFNVERVEIPRRRVGV